MNFQSFTLNLVIFISCFLISCIRLPGTNTGNPGNLTPGNAAHDPPTSLDLLSQSIIVNLCKTLIKCTSEIEVQNCYQSIEILPNMLWELGLNDGTFLTYQDLIRAESLSQISTNRNNFNDCMLSISQLECNSDLIIQSYQITEVNPFFKSPRLLSVDNRCRYIFLR